MKKTLVILVAAMAASAFTTGAMAEVQSLRGADLEQMSAKPERMKLMTVEGGIERSYKEQPPMVPHEVDKYEVNLKLNGCMKCHSPETYEKEKSPVIGESHFLDRDGNKLDRLSSRRYFCNQCHAPQLDGQPLVENQFQGRK
ncbi:MAG: nitrate reductase cytochrome c-type subunit [Pseudomonadota bacterium]|nr:nitrate reductase cytochrome c-type subunit [Pseudomonadota bacterium]